MVEDNDEEACMASKERRKFKNRLNLSKSNLPKYQRKKRKRGERKRFIWYYNCQKEGQCEEPMPQAKERKSVTT